MIIKPLIKYYVIVDKNGNADFSEIGYPAIGFTEEQAINNFCRPALRWEPFYKEGFRPVLVNINFIERFKSK